MCAGVISLSTLPAVSLTVMIRAKVSNVFRRIARGHTYKLPDRDYVKGQALPTIQVWLPQLCVLRA